MLRQTDVAARLRLIAKDFEEKKTRVPPTVLLTLDGDEYITFRNWEPCGYDDRVRLIGALRLLLQELESKTLEEFYRDDWEDAE